MGKELAVSGQVGVPFLLAIGFPMNGMDSGGENRVF